MTHGLPGVAAGVWVKNVAEKGEALCVVAAEGRGTGGSPHAQSGEGSPMERVPRVLGLRLPAVGGDTHLL